MGARAKGIKVGMFRPVTIWPSPEEKMRELSKQFDNNHTLVVEMNMGQYVHEVERVMHFKPNFLSKVDGLAIPPTEISEKVDELRASVEVIHV